MVPWHRKGQSHSLLAKVSKEDAQFAIALEIGAVETSLTLVQRLPSELNKKTIRWNICTNEWWSERGEGEYKDREQLGSKLGKAETQPLTSPNFRPHLQDRSPFPEMGVISQCFCGHNLTKK